MGFESSMARVNSQVIARLSDSDLTIGAATVRGVWGSTYNQALGMVDTNVPAVTVAAADAVGVVRGTIVTRLAVQYRVIGIEPDERGLVTLRLEQV